MTKIALTLTAAALMVACSLTGVSAQQGSGPMMQGGQGPRGPMMQDDRGRGPRTDGDRRGGHRFGPEMMMEGGMPSYGMMMGPGMMRMMLIVMDTDGDGALSLEEFQAVHERIFAAMDVDKDGKLTFDEMEGFMHGDDDADEDDDDD